MVNEKINNVIYTHNEILFNLKKNTNLDRYTIWMTLKDLMLNGIDKLQMDKYCMVP